MKKCTLLFLTLILIGNPLLASSGDIKVKISNELEYVDVKHNGNVIRIKRNQSPDNTINSNYAKTSRECPPFCIQPGTLAEGVETVAELEVLSYLKRLSDGDSSVLVIDSRTEDWVKKGTIPGSVNIPWTLLKPGAGADPFEIATILEDKFAAISIEGLWDFSNAKTLILFCNGMWCGQSPSNIKTLLRFGYPPHKLKWYRGGMQNWESLGLTVVK
jgi:rhodanese-related sulfurtransferase